MSLSPCSPLCPKVDSELRFLCSSAAAGRPPSPETPRQGHLWTPDRILARGKPTLPHPAPPRHPQPQAAETPHVHPSVCVGRPAGALRAAGAPGPPGATWCCRTRLWLPAGRAGGSAQSSRDGARQKRALLGGWREPARPSSHLHHAGQNQLMHQP